jgi:hypothetical protein
MTATDADGLAFNGVLLGIGAVAVKPKQGTDCLISIVEGDEASTILIYAHEADLILYNGGDNGGLVITPKLVEELDRTNELLTALINTINGSPIPEPGNSAPSALQTALKTAIATKSLGDYSAIENEKIKH